MNIVLQFEHVQRFSFLLTLATENALFLIHGFQDSVLQLEHFSGAGIFYGNFLLLCGINFVIDLNFWIWLKSSQGYGRPLRMHFANSFLHIETDINLLSFVELNNGDPHLLAIIEIWVELDWKNWLLTELSFALVHHVDGFDVQRCHLSYLTCIFTRVLVMHLQSEFNFACLAIVNVLWRAVAFPWVLVRIDLLAVKRDQTNSLCQKLVMQDWCVLKNWDQMRSHCGNFCN